MQRGVFTSKGIMLLPNKKIYIKTLDEVYDMWINHFAIGSFGSFCDLMKAQGNIIY